jgi:hypothetical protein
MKNPKSTSRILNIPEGKYYAKWCAYRGVNAKCIVEIKDGIVEIIDQ